MKIRSYEVAVLCVGAYLLFGAFGFGQTQQAQRKNEKTIEARDAQSGMASGRLEAQSGQASGKAAVTGQAQPAGKSRNSAHAVEAANAAQAADQKKLAPAQSNPLYQDSGKSGENPLYEGKDKTAKPNSGSGHDVVSYKDPEDMTTRRRAGDNKAAPATNKGQKNGGAAPQ